MDIPFSWPLPFVPSQILYVRVLHSSLGAEHGNQYLSGLYKSIACLYCNGANNMVSSQGRIRFKRISFHQISLGYFHPGSHFVSSSHLTRRYSVIRTLSFAVSNELQTNRGQLTRRGKQNFRLSTVALHKSQWKNRCDCISDTANVISI